MDPGNAGQRDRSWRGTSTRWPSRLFLAASSGARCPAPAGPRHMERSPLIHQARRPGPTERARRGPRPSPSFADPSRRPAVGAAGTSSPPPLTHQGQSGLAPCGHSRNRVRRRSSDSCHRRYPSCPIPSYDDPPRRRPGASSPPRWSPPCSSSLRSPLRRRAMPLARLHRCPACAARTCDPAQR